MSDDSATYHGGLWAGEIGDCRFETLGPCYQKQMKPSSAWRVRGRESEGGYESRW